MAAVTLGIGGQSGRAMSTELRLGSDTQLAPTEEWGPACATCTCRPDRRQLRGVTRGRKHNYHDIHRKLPPGYVYRPGPQSNHAEFSWGALALPQLEQGALQDGLYWNVPIFDPVNTTARETHLTVFICPSDPVSHDGFVKMGIERYAMASYAANFGPPDLHATQEKRDGVFSRNSATKFAKLTDGLSNTLCIGERVNGPFRNGASHGNHFEYETTWAGVVREIADPTDTWSCSKRATRRTIRQVTTVTSLHPMLGTPMSFFATGRFV